MDEVVFWTTVWSTRKLNNFTITFRNVQVPFTALSTEGYVQIFAYCHFSLCDVQELPRKAENRFSGSKAKTSIIAGATLSKAKVEIMIQMEFS